MTYWLRNAPTPASAQITECDARVFGGLMVICEFAGHELSPDGNRKCKLYDKSSQRSCCMYYHEEITPEATGSRGHCDNPKESMR